MNKDVLIRVGVSLAASGAIVAFALWRRSLAWSGAAAALVLGTVIGTCGGAPWFAVLAAFFFTSTAMGKVGKARKEAVKREFSKGDTRDMWQALANGGVAAAAALGMFAAPKAAMAGAFLGAMATATGDTWATELGVLSRGEPLSLVRFRRVPRGTSGAVSALGTAATVGGALAIGLVAAAGKELAGGDPFWMRPVQIVIVAVAGGTVGSLADSLLGATIQAGYHCPSCDKACEGETHHCGTAAKHTRGLSWFDNDVVNAVATLIGAFVGAMLTKVLWRLPM
jgi:uncharacterized protein (TIGR00297 family)